MTTPSEIHQLLDRNRAFAQTFDRGDLPIQPRFRTAVLTCIDARVDPAHFLGLELGESIVLRNMGGRVTPEILEALAFIAFLSARMAGPDAMPQELDLVLVHHTDCGLERLSNPEFRQAVNRRLGIPEARLEAMAIGPYEASLDEDIARLRQSDFDLTPYRVTGLLYDVTSGSLREVFPRSPIHS